MIYITKKVYLAGREAKRLHLRACPKERRRETCEGSWPEPTFAFSYKEVVRSKTDPAPEISRAERPRENERSSVCVCVCVYTESRVEEDYLSKVDPRQERGGK